MAAELSHAKRLAARMKAYEADFEDSITSEVPAILRADGHSFSRMAGFFTKPFDERYHCAMVETAKDLLKAHPAATIAYTASDEISLVFPNGLNTFNNRIQKIASVTAGLASVRFYVHLLDQIEKHKNDPGLKQIKSYGMELISHAHFDARIFALPDVDEAINCLIWRCRGDATRNAVNNFARMHYPSKKLHAKNTREVREMLKREKGLVFEECVPKWAVEGTLIKREMVEIEGLNPKTGKTEKALRTKMREVDRGITKLDEESLHIVTSKYWGNGPSSADVEHDGEMDPEGAAEDVEEDDKSEYEENGDHEDEEAGRGSGDG